MLRQGKLVLRYLYTGISLVTRMSNFTTANPSVRPRAPERDTSTDKRKERKSIYIAPFRTKVHPKRSGMDHTVIPASNTMPGFPSWRSPDVTTTVTEAADIQLQLTTHLSTPKG